MRVINEAYTSQPLEQVPASGGGDGSVGSVRLKTQAQY